jgi:hypothetical protein
VAWKGQPDVFGGTRIEQAKQDALACTDENQFSMAEHSVVE